MKLENKRAHIHDGMLQDGNLDLSQAGLSRILSRWALSLGVSNNKRTKFLVVTSQSALDPPKNASLLRYAVT